MNRPRRRTTAVGVVARISQCMEPSIDDQSVRSVNWSIDQFVNFSIDIASSCAHVDAGAFDLYVQSVCACGWHAGRNVGQHIAGPKLFERTTQTSAERVRRKK